MNTNRQVALIFCVSLLFVSVSIAQTERMKSVPGQVVDEDGNPIAGAEVWLPISFAEPEHTAKATTDESGQFKLEFPESWLDPVTAKNLWDVWAYKPGRSLAASSASRTLFSGMSNIPVEIVMGEEADTSFTVRGSDESGVANATVRPMNFRTPTGFALIPEGLSHRLSTQTNEQGVAKLSAIPRAGLYSVYITSDEYGLQMQRLQTGEDLEPEIAVDLRAVGSIHGKLVADDMSMVDGIRLYFESSSRSASGRQASGIADITVGADGQFEIPAIAEGTIRIDVVIDETLPVRVRIPDSTEVESGRKLTMTIPVVDAVEVSGRILVGDTGEPIEGALISVRYGVFRQGQRVVSDEAGRYSAYVLPGSCYQQVISLPKGIDAIQTGTPWEDRFDVPEDEEVFELPQIELASVERYRGRLIDQNGDGIPNVRLNAVAGNRRMGFCQSDEEGNFIMRLPRDQVIDSFQSWRNDHPVILEVVDESPLLLRMRTE